MKNTEQRSLRLSRYHLKIINKVQLEKGLNFTDAVKHIISGYADGLHAENSLDQFFRKLNSKLSTIRLSDKNETNYFGDAVVEELQNLGKNIDLILNALYIIGSSNSRTLGAIDDLFKEDVQK